MPSRRALSMLEALPVEIIEQIFLYSLNLNLPRASGVLATALSREHIYKLLIVLAFWDDPPSEYPGSEAIDRVFGPLEYVSLTLDQRVKLQEQVLRCQWCTMKRVQEQIPTMMILTIHRQWINAGMTMEPDQQAALERFMARKDDTVRVFHGKGPPLKRAAQLASHPEMMRLANLPGPHEYEMHITPNVLIEIRSRTMKTVVSWPALQLQTFPPHLLRGRSTGFTEEDVLFLELLRMCSHNYTPVNSPLIPSTTTTVDRTALNEGVSNAIRNQNLEALVTLLKIDEFIFRYNTSNQGRAPFYTIPSDHFINVTKHGRENPGQNVAFFMALIRASAESLPAAAREIAEWTLDMRMYAGEDRTKYQEVNGKFVAWLCDFAVRFPVQNALGFPSSQLFSCGELNTFDLEGQRFADEVLKTRRNILKNYMPESPVNPGECWLKKFGPELPPNFVRSYG